MKCWYQTHGLQLLKLICVLPVLVPLHIAVFCSQGPLSRIVARLVAAIQYPALLLKVGGFAGRWIVSPWV